MIKKNNLLFTCITIIILYCFLKNILFIPLSSKIFNYIINPIFILLLAIFSYFYLRPKYSRYKNKKSKLQTIIIVLLIYIILYFSSGLIIGYESSPYSHSLYNIIGNIVSLLLPVLLEEYIRFCLIKNVNKKLINYVFITIIFCLLEISFQTLFTNILTISGSIKYTFGTILPLIVKNALLTYLMVMTGLLPAVIYKGFLQLCIILLPIFPKLNWFTTGLIGLILPFSIYLLINKYMEKKIYKYKQKSIVKRIPLYLSLAILILFFYGEFKYRPVAIMSNSMSPFFKIGDVVIIENVTEKNIKKIKVGTVIMYQLDNVAIIHRIIKIIKVDGEEKYITKGDNNVSADSKSVYNSQVLGIEKISIPKIGYPSVMLQSFINSREADTKK